MTSSAPALNTKVVEETSHPRALASLATSLKQYRKLLPGLSPQLDMIKVLHP